MIENNRYATCSIVLDCPMASVGGAGSVVCVAPCLGAALAGGRDSHCCQLASLNISLLRTAFIARIERKSVGNHFLFQSKDLSSKKR